LAHLGPPGVVDAAAGETRVGRFGWKAQHAALLAFAGDASVNELGITNRLFPHHNLPNLTAAKASFGPTSKSKMSSMNLQASRTSTDWRTSCVSWRHRVVPFTRAAGSALHGSFRPPAQSATHQ
jgi:CxxC motif-containing protein (DUF1111 family)